MQDTDFFCREQDSRHFLSLSLLSYPFTEIARYDFMQVGDLVALDDLEQELAIWYVSSI